MNAEAQSAKSHYEIVLKTKAKSSESTDERVPKDDKTTDIIETIQELSIDQVDESPTALNENPILINENSNFGNKNSNLQNENSQSVAKDEDLEQWLDDILDN